MRRPYQHNPTSYRTTYPIPNIPTGEPSCQELGNVNAASPRGRVVRAALTLTLGYHGGLQSIAEHVGAQAPRCCMAVEPARLRRKEAWRWGAGGSGGAWLTMGRVNVYTLGLCTSRRRTTKRRGVGVSWRRSVNGSRLAARGSRFGQTLKRKCPSRIQTLTLFVHHTISSM